MQYGKMAVDLRRQPVEVGILVDHEFQSGPFVANRERRGLSISDNQQLICLTADEALELLEWLRDQEQDLRAMVAEEVEAVATVEQRLGAFARTAGDEG
ncbi:MAG TPA: hypothetical protein VE268_12250 [Herpetosiphonaceae bacterium]|jgi:hypothetical protein|nr:hypothetical protein [Herpetosiphonaceae bacterium]